jgi:urease subunit alpha
MTAGLPEKIGLKKMVRPVSHCRGVGKKDLVHNSGTSNIEVDPKSYEVNEGSKLITYERESMLPLTQRYFLF